MSVEMQPGFPGEDLSKANADRLALLLCDQEMLDILHEKAETIRYAHKVGHEVAGHMLQLSEQFSEEQLAAIDYGMSVHEAASVFLQPEMNWQEMGSLEHNGKVRLHIIRSLGEISRDPFNGLDELDDQFRDEHPIGSDVVGELADIRFPRRYVDDAIAGAALARYIELEAAKVG